MSLLHNTNMEIYSMMVPLPHQFFQSTLPHNQQVAIHDHRENTLPTIMSHDRHGTNTEIDSMMLPHQFFERTPSHNVLPQIQAANHDDMIPPQDESFDHAFSQSFWFDNTLPHNLFHHFPAEEVAIRDMIPLDGEVVHESFDHPSSPSFSLDSTLPHNLLRLSRQQVRTNIMTDEILHARASLQSFSLDSTLPHNLVHHEQVEIPHMMAPAEFVDIGGLSDAVISKHLKLRNNLRGDAMNSTSDDGELGFCVICQDDLLCRHQQQAIGSLDCGHDYHAECITNWLRQTNNCPLCKAKALPCQFFVEYFGRRISCYSK